jgi:hypothetical protein
MICPQMTRSQYVVLPGEGCGPETMTVECQRDKCAWWNAQAEACAVLVLSWPAGQQVAREERSDRR